MWDSLFSEKEASLWKTSVILGTVPVHPMPPVAGVLVIVVV